MDYKEYYETYYNYRKAKNKLHRIQNDIADVINAMLSVTAKMKDDIGRGSNTNDKMLSLTAKKIDLEGQEVIAKELLSVREKQKNDAEKEFRDNASKTKDVKDVIYIKYFIDHIKPKTISSQLAYSTSYVYDILNQIREFISKYDSEHK